MTHTKGLANELLGYPADARLLLVNTDDFGMCHAANEGTMRAFEAGVVRSCTLMLPCPWSLHGRKLLRANPGLAFGVHLTAISEQPDYRWGPVLDRGTVPSLLDESGYFFSEARFDELMERARPAELEAEFRAQIEAVIGSGLRPTHLDSHCGVHERRDWAIELTVGLAKEYGLAIRLGPGAMAEALRRQGRPTLDHELLDSYNLPIADKAARYARLLRELPPGLSEWAVHPALDSAELRAVEPDSQVRQTDYEFLVSPEASAIIAQEGIVLLDYRALQRVWQAAG
jgi:predicted glycoside hydrolase/deacetylase ChbG (UPF0249 family)